VYVPLTTWCRAGCGPVLHSCRWFNRLIYFHRNSVVDGSFDTLQPRDAVKLVVQTKESDIGPQASTVRRISAMAYDPATKPSRR
jgi:hypothetical protein